MWPPQFATNSKQGIYDDDDYWWLWILHSNRNFRVEILSSINWALCNSKIFQSFVKSNYSPVKVKEIYNSPANVTHNLALTSSLESLSNQQNNEKAKQSLANSETVSEAEPI